MRCPNMFQVKGEALTSNALENPTKPAKAQKIWFMVSQSRLFVNPWLGFSGPGLHRFLVTDKNRVKNYG